MIGKSSIGGAKRNWLRLAATLPLLLAGAAAGQPAEPPRGPRIGADLERALGRPLPEAGLAVAVALRDTDLPRRGAERRAAVQARQKRVLDALPSDGIRLKRRYRTIAGFAGWMSRAAIEALARHDEVATVYLDGRVYASLAQGVILVGADTAHAQGFTGAGVKVAVLDSGIDTDHPDLVGDLVAQHCFCDTHPSPRIGCCPGGDDESASAEDDDGHGTSVSGIITSDGVVASTGVAPDAKIVALKVIDGAGGGTFSDVAAALDWVLTERGIAGSPVAGTGIVNLSLGDGGEYNDPAVSPCTGTNTANAIAALHADGVAVFAASGNEGHDDGISFPACVPQAISVGGVYDAALGSVSWCGNASCTTTLCIDNPTAVDTFVCHSNSDETLDLLAPNWRTVAPDLGGVTTAFGGTSASSPYAAAEAAILLQADPSLTPESIRTIMKSNGPAVTNPDNGLAFTRTDVGAAVVQVAPAVCGNGAVESGEECDDGGTLGGDCCSPTCTFEPLASPCGDGDACNGSESCDGNGDCLSGTPLACDDGLFCNGQETCDPATGCVTGTPPVLDDAVACTADACDEADDVVSHTPDDTACDDGLFCNGQETCDPLNDCQPGAPPATGDGVACTSDSCDEVNDVVVHEPDDAACDDGAACTADACDALTGCSHDPIPFCGSGVAATPRRAPAVLALAFAASGALLLARRGDPARSSG